MSVHILYLALYVRLSFYEDDFVIMIVAMNLIELKNMGSNLFSQRNIWWPVSGIITPESGLLTPVFMDLFIFDDVHQSRVSKSHIQFHSDPAMKQTLPSKQTFRAGMGCVERNLNVHGADKDSIWL